MSAEELADQLTAKHWTISVAESCTGGLLGQMITSMPGSSAYFHGGITAYSDTAKIELLGVPEECIHNHGAVSNRTALAMATGVRDAFRVDIGVAVTGIAGPGGGTEAKPVGLVYVAIAGEENERIEELNLKGSREEIRKQAAKAALKLACDFIADQEDRPGRAGSDAGEADGLDYYGGSLPEDD